MMIDVMFDVCGVCVIMIDNFVCGNVFVSVDVVCVFVWVFVWDDGVCVVVLCGSGVLRYFCSGIDLCVVCEVFVMDEWDVVSDLVLVMEACEASIVGAVYGDCVNAGFEFAFGCDVLVVSEDVWFVDMYVMIGILLSWGLSVKLSWSVGVNAARACSVFGRAMDARRAEALGLTCVMMKDVVLVKVKVMEMVMVVCEMVLGGVSVIKCVIYDGLGVDEARAAERRRAFANYRVVVREKFVVFNVWWLKF